MCLPHTRCLQALYCLLVVAFLSFSICHGMADPKHSHGGLTALMLPYRTRHKLTTRFAVAKMDSPKLCKSLWNSKRTLRTFTSLQTHLAMVNTDFSNIYKPPARFTEVKTDSLNFYKANTHFAVVKMEYPNIYKPPTRFVVIKTNYPNVYKCTTRFAVVKNGLSEHLQASYTLFGCQNGFKISKSLLHAFRTS